MAPPRTSKWYGKFARNYANSNFGALELGTAQMLIAISQLPLPFNDAGRFTWLKASRGIVTSLQQQKILIMCLFLLFLNVKCIMSIETVFSCLGKQTKQSYIDIVYYYKL